MPLQTSQWRLPTGLVIGNDTNYDVVGVRGLADRPPVRSVEVARLDADGAFPTRNEILHERTVQLDVATIGMPGAEMDSRLAELFRGWARSKKGEGAKPLEFLWPVGYGMGERVVFGYMRTATVLIGPEEGQGWVQHRLVMMCDDPLVYSAEQSSVGLGLEQESDGVEFDMVAPITFGVSASPGTAVAVNEGNSNTFPTIQILGPVTNPIVLNETYDEAIRINLTVAPGDSLSIDMQSRSVLLNGTASRRFAVSNTSTFWALRPGVNQLRFIASGYDSDALATVSWRSAWE